MAKQGSMLVVQPKKVHEAGIQVLIQAHLHWVQKEGHVEKECLSKKA